MLIVSAIFVLSGAMLSLIAALGVLRLPDFFMRMHAATKAGVAGPVLILIGVGFYDMSLASWIKVALAALFLLITTPVAGHMLGYAGFTGGVKLWSGTRKNALQHVLKRGRFHERAESTCDAEQGHS